MTCRNGLPFTPRPGAPTPSWRAPCGSVPPEATMHAETEARFASALLDRQATVPPGLKATPRRFALYRGNVSAALVGALETRFPVSAQIVGDAFFRAMAAEFVITRPPISPVLLDYGDE